MPIPAAPSARTDTSATVLALFGQVHRQLRQEIVDQGDEALNWVPTAGANSIATIVTHLLGSEAETVRCVAGVACERDRDAEFTGTQLRQTEVLDLLDRADALIGELEPRITDERLSAVFPLPTCPPDEVRPGLTWLVGTYGHSREHLGQVQLTRQLYGDRR